MKDEHMKVLIIEDEAGIIDAVRLAFEFRWPEAVVIDATTGKEGIEKVRTELPDVAILDINLPDMSGFEVLKEIRSFSSVPLIILSVRSEDTDILRGLETGADDYVIKPFNYLTLLSRVKAVLRRSVKSTINTAQITDINSRLKINFIDQKVILDNRPVKLTPIEYRLLVSLVKNKDKVIDDRQLREEIWPDKAAKDTESLRIYVRRLRKKLGDIPPRMILNKRGSGYIFISS
jgi:DNA-binding response OmpR family regulator